MYDFKFSVPLKVKTLIFPYFYIVNLLLRALTNHINNILPRLAASRSTL